MSWRCAMRFTLMLNSFCLRFSWSGTLCLRVLLVVLAVQVLVSSAVSAQDVTGTPPAGTAAVPTPTIYIPGFTEITSTPTHTATPDRPVVGGCPAFLPGDMDNLSPVYLRRCARCFPTATPSYDFIPSFSLPTSDPDWMTVPPGSWGTATPFPGGSGDSGGSGGITVTPDTPASSTPGGSVPTYYAWLVPGSENVYQESKYPSPGRLIHSIEVPGDGVTTVQGLVYQTSGRTLPNSPYSSSGGFSARYSANSFVSIAHSVGLPPGDEFAVFTGCALFKDVPDSLCNLPGVLITDGISRHVSRLPPFLGGFVELDLSPPSFPTGIWSFAYTLKVWLLLYGVPPQMPTPTPTLTPTQAVPRIDLPDEVDYDCSVPIWRDATPLVDVSGLGYSDRACYSLFEGGSFSILGRDVSIPGVTLCVRYVTIPSVTILGLVIPLDTIVAFLVAVFFIRILITF